MIRDLVETAVAAVAGGVLVVFFAAIGEGLRPKRFAGLFSAAPSIAIAGLVVTVAAEGDATAAKAALAMVLGAAGFVAFCLSARLLLDRSGALLSSAVGCVAWVAVALGGYFAVFR